MKFVFTIKRKLIDQEDLCILQEVATTAIFRLSINENQQNFDIQKQIDASSTMILMALV